MLHELLGQSPFPEHPHTLLAVQTGRSGSSQSKSVTQPSSQVPSGPAPVLHTGVGLEQSPSPLGQPHSWVLVSHTGRVGSGQSPSLTQPGIQVPSGPSAGLQLGRLAGQSASPLGQPQSPVVCSHTGRFAAPQC